MRLQPPRGPALARSCAYTDTTDDHRNVHHLCLLQPLRVLGGERDSAVGLHTRFLRLRQAEVIGVVHLRQTMPLVGVVTEIEKVDTIERIYLRYRFQN